MAFEGGQRVIEELVEHPDTAADASIGDRLGAVLHAVADGVTVQDRTGRVVYANAAAARLIGSPSVDALLAASPQAIAAGFELFDENGDPLSVSELPGRVALAGIEPPPRTVR